MDVESILAILESQSDLKAVAGMARAGIVSVRIFGVKVPVLRMIAKKIGVDHRLALKLWETGYRETRILASYIADPTQVTGELMDKWIEDFENWEICDQVCYNLFWKTPYAFDKCFEWSERKNEFEKRAAFALIASIAWKDKKASDDIFEKFIPLIVKGSDDPRNYVKKAVDWALRKIGNRSVILNRKAREAAQHLIKTPSRTSKWIGKNALKELERKQRILEEQE